jgi:hypothetical protein
MTPPADPTAVADLLLAAPGIEQYPLAFPVLLDPRALRAGSAAATLLTRAARDGPRDDALARYERDGELGAFRRAGGDPARVRAEVARWQRVVSDAADQAERNADALDGERVTPPAPDATWAGYVRRVRRALDRDAERPGKQLEAVRRAEAGMKAAAERFKAALRDRVHGYRAELAERRDELPPDAARLCDQLLDQADDQLGADGSPFLALTKLGKAADALRTGSARRATLVERYAVAVRRNPVGGPRFDLEKVHLLAAQSKPLPPALEPYLPTGELRAEAAARNGFLYLHSHSGTVSNWLQYFNALETWLGLDRAKRRSRPDIRVLEPVGKELPGRPTFLFAEPWQGAPYYADGGERKILAVVRLRLPDELLDRPLAVARLATDALRMMAGPDPQTADEKRFRSSGLVLVLLPGAALDAEPYAQFRRTTLIGCEFPGGLHQRVAFVDDVDLLRLLPVPADRRFRALLEVALPRFQDVLAATFQNSDPVRPYMFFGRTDELTRLKEATAVVYSGRRMGKSSLLHRLRNSCEDTDQRAVYVGCTVVPRNRPWELLAEIERGLLDLLRRERVPDAELPPLTPAGPQGVARVASGQAVDGFRRVLAAALALLAARGVRTLFVLMDEADNFVLAEMHETSGGASRAVVSWFLKGLQNDTYPGRLRFVFAGFDQLALVVREPYRGQAAFGNWGGDPMRLGPLADDDARQLAAAPLAALGITLSEDAVERVLDYTDRHASLIQAFAQRLADRVKKEWADVWPLADVAVTADDLTAVAAGRGDPGVGFGDLVDETLGLNLDVARHHPVKLLFLALASPTGAANRGRLLGPDSFTAADAARQVAADDDTALLSDAEIASTLELLSQLGLLERVGGDGAAPEYRFRANHYVRRLRTQNGFADRLRAAVADWRQRAAGDRGQADPRLVWTMSDTDLRALQAANGPAVLTGLPKSGRTRLARVLTQEQREGEPPRLFLDAADEYEAALADWQAGGAGPLVFDDADGRVPWVAARAALAAAAAAGRPLWWVGGPGLAWELAADPDLALAVDPRPLGPLTPAELEPWTARPPSGLPSTDVLVPERDRGPILAAVGGLLPVLEEFRAWLLARYASVPDPLQETHAREFRKVLEDPDDGLAAAAAGRLADGLPAEFRAGLHALFTGASDYGQPVVHWSNLRDVHAGLARLDDNQLNRLMLAAEWLGLVPKAPGGGYDVPYDTAVGLLVRHPRFAAP